MKSDACLTSSTTASRWKWLDITENGAEVDFTIPLGLPEDTQEDVIEFRTGTEQIESLDGPAGDVDEGLGLGYVAKFSHAL
jgi:hypothetical protein